MAMRVTQRSGRVGSARHNDRSFMRGDYDREAAAHIDLERTEQNRVVGARQGMTLEESELAFYRMRYSASLEQTNARYREQRHPEKCRTIEDVYRNEKTRPRETILQIGDMNEGVSAEKLMECFKDYLEKVKAWNKSHGDHLRILNFSVHVDEASPHIHMRSVWEYDQGDHKALGQNKALQSAGVSLPEPDKKESRYNNRMMTVEAEFRGYWQETCKEHGLEIETEPRPRRKHLDKADYIAEQKQKELKELDNELASSKKTIKRAKALESKIEALEGQERVLNAAQVAEVKKDVKKSLLNANEVKLPLSDYEKLIRTAAAVDEARKQADRVNKKKKSIIEDARSEAKGIVKEAHERADKLIQEGKHAKQEGLFERADRLKAQNTLDAMKVTPEGKKFVEMMEQTVTRQIKTKIRDDIERER